MDPADCEDCEGRGWVIQAPDGDDSRDWIERCDACTALGSDEEAAFVAYMDTGREVGHAISDVAESKRERPYLMEHRTEVTS